MVVASLSSAMIRSSSRIRRKARSLKSAKAIAAGLALVGALSAESALAGYVIGFESGYPPGAIVISQGAKALYPSLIRGRPSPTG
jgi:hypothetical protein